MKNLLAHCGSVLWNLVDYNEKVTILSFKAVKPLLTAKEYFLDFSFMSSTASSSGFRESNYVYSQGSGIWIYLSFISTY